MAAITLERSPHGSTRYTGTNTLVQKNEPLVSGGAMPYFLAIRAWESRNR
ncbi:MAG: hypothetical protein IPO93_07375 [Actinobacteria bacterium]|nr:hypothetical protein [Actinomycetota bacterium]